MYTNKFHDINWAVTPGSRTLSSILAPSPEFDADGHHLATWDMVPVSLRRKKWNIFDVHVLLFLHFEQTFTEQTFPSRLDLIQNETCFAISPCQTYRASYTFQSTLASQSDVPLKFSDEWCRQEPDPESPEGYYHPLIMRSCKGYFIMGCQWLCTWEIAMELEELYRL